MPEKGEEDVNECIFIFSGKCEALNWDATSPDIHGWFNLQVRGAATGATCKQ